MQFITDRDLRSSQRFYCCDLVDEYETGQAWALKLLGGDYAIFKDDLSLCVVSYFLLVGNYDYCGFGFFVEFLN
jgi:hypothetical protein